jgi:ADP-ribose pyrophosphatase YjhB (NUDIX family)
MPILEGWRYCPRCAAEVERGEDHVRCPACGFVAWANSVPAVQALVERDGKLLLARRAVDPGRGMWDLPGGFLQEGEHPLDGLRRELLEETGLELESAVFVDAWLDPYEGRTVLGLSYDVVAGPGDPLAADDVAELRWFGPGELPGGDEFAFPSHPTVVGLWRDKHA